MTLHRKYSKSFLKRMSHKYDKLLKAGLIDKPTYFYKKKEIKEKLLKMEAEMEEPKKRVMLRVKGNYTLNNYQ